MNDLHHVAVDPKRGVYDARRAAALAGVPKSTLHYWARTGLYAPSIAPGPPVRLWSWFDLLALRCIDWLRRTKEENEPRRVSIPKMRRALQQLEDSGVSREMLHRVGAVSKGGDLYLICDDGTWKADRFPQGAMGEVLDLVRPYGLGPDLLEPRPRLRIIPGKLHGEPHIANTRIPSAAIFALYRSGYDVGAIREMYPEASTEAIEEAIDLEASLNKVAA